AKYFHTQSAYYEFESYSYHNLNKRITKETREQYLDSALQSAIKARDLCLQIKNPDKKFQYDIQNRIYHQTAYLGNWKFALEQAQLGLKILKDTLSQNNKIFVDLIYDIGFINSKLGDYSKAVEKYQLSLDLYKTIIGENNTDVAQAYNNIAVEYRNLGLHKKELESLIKAKNIWETLNNDDDKQFLYRCYGNLFYWYSYYGDFDKAEAYILKKQKLRSDKFATQPNGFLRNKEEIYQDQLNEWYDLMLHYSRKEDTIKTEFYAKSIIKKIKTDKPLLNFETNILIATLKFYANFIKAKNKEYALSLLEKAIKIQQTYKEKYYTKEFPFLLAKAELLFNSEKSLEAKPILETLDSVSKKQEILDRFKLFILKAKINHKNSQNDVAQNNFDAALSLLKTDNTTIEQLTIDNLKPLISFEVIDGFLAMGNFYMDMFKHTNNYINLQKATHRYLLASKIYEQLYLGNHYNNTLYITYNAINTHLLNALENYRNEKLLIKVINAIENNSSKLTWSKFVFNNQRQQLDLPQALINKEEGIKAQLNFYQKAMLSVANNPEEKVMLWKEKIYELKEALLKIQDTIKQKNESYYQFNIKDFDVTNLQKGLENNAVVLKYIQTDTKLYSFLISNKTIKLWSVKNKDVVINTLKSCLETLKNRQQNYQALLNQLKGLLFENDEYKTYEKITIIPDGALHSFPFESLILDKHMPNIGYATSLLLYNEQKATTSNFESVKLGAFCASNVGAKLPNAPKEINAILKIFKGKAFLNASKAEFLNQSNQFNVLHLAMHSNINETQPDYSSLNFYGKDKQLFISELYNETFNANMVVLSACETGNGFYENGEGVISLSRAFNYAGIPSTVVSLWKVDDEATSKVMTYFYEHLKQGEKKDEALKNAKLDYLEHTDDELLKHPYYWSGFVLTGNTDALVKSGTYYWYCLFILLLLLFVFRKRLIQLFKK
ncbi:MAG: CHAT domain-containing protein, partial [Gelidibacter sp.]|nr:CHAT domain-containing protein [Gelidibacter sp.]